MARYVGYVHAQVWGEQEVLPIASAKGLFVPHGVRGKSPNLFFTFGSGNKKVLSPRTVVRWQVAFISATPGAVLGHVAAHSARALSTSIAQARVFWRRF